MHPVGNGSPISTVTMAKRQQYHMRALKIAPEMKSRGCPLHRRHNKSDDCTNLQHYTHTSVRALSLKYLNKRACKGKSTSISHLNADVDNLSLVYISYMRLKSNCLYPIKQGNHTESLRSAGCSAAGSGLWLGGDFTGVVVAGGSSSPVVPVLVDPGMSSLLACVGVFPPLI